MSERQSRLQTRDPGALAREVFDVAVIGAGVLGAAIAREAALRGLSVALFDRGDFGAEASGNNLRILHGGVRSLSRGHVAAARAGRAALVEWAGLAPGLVDPLRVLAPTPDPILPALASAVANLVLRPGHTALPPRAGRLSRAALTAAVPGLTGARGGFAFDDGIAYSTERLVLELVKDADHAGAVVANHVEALAGEVSDGRLRAVRWRDRLAGTEGEVRSDLFVNATGGAISDVAARLGAEPTAVCPPLSYSVNVLVPSLGLSHAVGLGHGRRFFFVPWRDRTVIGTAHFPVGDRPSRDEAIARLLEDANRVWPGDPIEPRSALASHAGWVLAASAPGAPLRLAERPVLVGARTSGLAGHLTVATPKFTSALALARRALELGAREAGLRLGPPASPDRPRAGAPEAKAGFEADVVRHTARLYGAEAPHVYELGEAGGTARIADGSPVVVAHLRYAVAHEMAVTEDDLLLRRTELGALGLAEAGRAAAREALGDAPSEGAR